MLMHDLPNLEATQQHCNVVGTEKVDKDQKMEV